MTRRVSVNLCIGEVQPPVKGEPHQQPWPSIKTIWEAMFNEDIVVVNAAGNKGMHPGRSDVDTVPTIYESEEFPLIVVSAVDNDGNVPIM